MEPVDDDRIAKSPLLQNRSDVVLDVPDSGSTEPVRHRKGLRRNQSGHSRQRSFPSEDVRALQQR
jgi:hypothetical protein